MSRVSSSSCVAIPGYLQAIVPPGVADLSRCRDFVLYRCGARNNNLFPYPFLTFNPFEIRVAIYAGATTLALLFFFLLNNIKKRVERVAKGKGRSGAVNGAPRGRKP